jgi:nucleoside-diphosphate kinase
MNYVRVHEDLSSRNIALLIFLPDAVASHLVGSVECWIRDRTACAPIARCWFSYTDDVLSRFYADIAGKPFWPLISRFFTAAPCLATLWYGDDAARLMPVTKGMTHPAQCSDVTVRGRFWCDNALANLVHVSDSQAELARELNILRSLQSGLFDGALSTKALPPYYDSRPPVPRHSGILTLCALVTTCLSTQGTAFSQLDLREGESARETISRAHVWLDETRKITPTALATSVETYLAGTADASQLILALRNIVPVSPWEELILTAGLLSRPHWLRDRSFRASDHVSDVE